MPLFSIISLIKANYSKIPLILLIYFCNNTVAQVSNDVIININQSSNQFGSIQETINLSLTSTRLSNQVKLKMDISDHQGKVIFKLSTIPFSLNQGILYIDANILRYQLQALVEVGSFDTEPPSGNYRLQITIVDFNDRILASNFSNITFTEGRKRRNTFIKPGLNGQVLSQLSTRQGTASALPPNYLRTDLRPELSIWDIPFNANIFYTTEENRQRQQMNQINFQFNHAEFRQNLIDKVAQKMRADKLKDIQKMKEFNNLKGELTGIDTYLNKEDWKDLDKIEEMNRLESIVSDSSLSGLNAAKRKALEKTKKAAVAPYEMRIKILNNEINMLNDAPFIDSLFEEKKIARIDSLHKELLNTIAKKDSAEQKIKLPAGTNKSWWDAKNKLENLKASTPNLKKLEAQKVRYERLMERKKQLDEWQRKAENAAVINAITDDNLDYEIGNLRDPDLLKQKLKSFGMFSGESKALYSFRAISVGSIFPAYSSLILDGIQLTGGNIEINPGNFYLAACGGRSRRIASFPGIPESGFNQNMFFVKTGIGRPERTHIYVSALRILDQTKNDFDTSIVKYPTANLILGTDVKISFLKGKIIFGGEGALSQYIKNRNAPDLDLGDYNQIVQRIPVFLPPNIATNIDFAYNFGTRVNVFKNKTVFEAFKRYIGPGYFSLGTPFLRNDLNRTEANIRQNLFKNILELTGFYRYDVDNLLQFKNFITKTRSIGTELNFNHNKLPRLHLIFAPSTQENPFGIFRILMIGGGTAYNFKIKRIYNNINFSFNRGINFAPGDTSNYSSQAFTTFYSVQISNFTSVAVSYSSNILEGNGNQISFSGISGNVNFKISKKVNQSFRSTYFTGSSNLSYSFNSLTQFRISKNVSFDFNIMKNVFDDRSMILNSFSEWMVNTGLQFNF